MDVADDELGLPKSTVVKMVQDALAPLGGLRMSPECRDLVVDCCAEFVNAVASEANEISTKEKKTTINPDHVLAALRALGFEAYEAECAIARDEAKEEETEKRQMKKAKKMESPCRRALLRGRATPPRRQATLPRRLFGNPPRHPSSSNTD